MRKALALGVAYEDGVNNSMEVDADLSAQEVADLMQSEFAYEFDDIFMVVNWEGCPDVEHHWRRGKHFN
jgi:hypothetical protein